MVARAGITVRPQVRNEVGPAQAEQVADVPADEGATGRSETAGVVKHPDWKKQASCLDHPQLDWDGDVRRSLFVICMACPVKMECLVEGLDHEERSDAGVWGGTDVEQRRLIRKGLDPYAVWQETAEILELL